MYVHLFFPIFKPWLTLLAWGDGDEMLEPHYEMRTHGSNEKELDQGDMIFGMF